MFNTVVVMVERAPSVVWRVNANTLNFSSELLFKRLESEQIVAEDEFVIEMVILRDTVRRVAGLGRIFQQNTRLKLGAVLLPNPRQFQFLFARHAHVVAEGGEVGEGVVAGADAVGATDAACSRAAMAAMTCRDNCTASVMFRESAKYPLAEGKRRTSL